MHVCAISSKLICGLVHSDSQPFHRGAGVAADLIPPKKIRSGPDQIYWRFRSTSANSIRGINGAIRFLWSTSRSELRCIHEDLT